MLRRTAKRDRMVGLFAAGVVLLNPPILTLVNGTVFGWPAAYVYLFLVWGALIAGVALVNEYGSGHSDERDRDNAAQ
jgi:hypothetical protein